MVETSGSDEATINVIAVDDHVSYAHGLQALCKILSDDIRITAVGESAEEGVQLVAELRPDVVLLDIRMPGRQGIDAAKKICAQFPASKVVMLTASSEAQDVLESMRAGASGYLTKDIEPNDLLQAIRTVTRGEMVLAPAAARIAFSQSRAELSALTDLELEILKLLARGSDLSDVASEVTMSESTLKRTIRDIQRKLGVDNRMQAIVAAAKKGLI